MISGVVVASRPEWREEVSEAIEQIPWADVHFSDESGRLVVTVEANGVEQSMDRLKQLEGMPKVLSAALSEYCLEGNEV